MGVGVMTVRILCSAGSAGAVNRGAINTRCVKVPAHVFLFLQAVDENRAIAMFVHAAARRAAIAH